MSQPEQLDQPSSEQYSQQPPTAPSQDYTMVNADGTPVVQPIREEKSLGGKIVKMLLIGLGAGLLGAIAWGGLAYLTERIFAIVAIGIGFGVAYGLALPFSRPLSKTIIALLVVPVLGFTIGAVLLGDFFYASLLVAKEADVGIMEAAGLVRPLFIQFMTEESETLRSVLFGLLGAIVGLYQIVKRT